MGTTKHCYIQNTEVLGIVVSERDFFFSFSHCKSMRCIHVMSFKEESGRFFFHFREIFEKCIEYIGKFLIHFREILNFCQKVVLFLKNFHQFYGSFPGVSLMMREVSHVWRCTCCHGNHNFDTICFNT